MFSQTMSDGCQTPPSGGIGSINKRAISPVKAAFQGSAEARSLMPSSKKPNLEDVGVVVQYQPESLMILAARALNNTASISEVSKNMPLLDQYFKKNNGYLEQQCSIAALTIASLLPKKCGVYTIGSHARRDALPSSEYDLAVVNAAQEDQDKVVMQLSGAGLFFNKDVDFKTSMPSSLLMDSSLGNVFYPSQFLHNRELNQYPYSSDILPKFIEAIKSGRQGDFNRKFYKKVVINSCITLQKVVKSSDAGLFDQQRDIKAVKAELLRPIQNVMDKFVVVYIRGSKDSDQGIDFLRNMPHDVVGQIEYLYGKGLINKIDESEVVDLQNNYKIGVFYYHMAKLLDRCGVSLNVNPDMIGVLLGLYKSTSKILSKLMG